MSHSTYPIASDVVAYLAAIGSGNSISSTMLGNWLAAAIASLERQTRRQFVTTTETRYFDGSGTGELALDDYVSISSVKLYGVIGASSPLNFAGWCEEAVYGSPKSKILIARGSIPAFSPIFVERWPEGRRNVEVTGTWGYGSAVPDDVWQGLIEVVGGLALDATAVSLSANSGSVGPVMSWQEGDIRETFDASTSFSEKLGSCARFARLVKIYAKSGSQRLKAQRGMI